MAKCSFCSEFHSESSGNLFLEIIKDLGRDSSRILFEASHWIVVPTIGSIVPGYLLIVSKEHYASVSLMPDNTYLELCEIIESIKILFGLVYNKKSLIFEHGAISPLNKGPCCVDHAHVHIVPFDDIAVYPIVEKEFNFITCEDSFHEIKNKVANFKLPYLFIQDTDDSQYLTFDEKIPSQYMRKVIASYTDYPDRWNWAEYIFLDNMIDTIKTLKNRI